jgi:hypothetical protein
LTRRAYSPASARPPTMTQKYYPTCHTPSTTRRARSTLR